MFKSKLLGLMVLLTNGINIATFCFFFTYLTVQISFDKKRITCILRASTTFERDSEAVFGLNIEIWGFTICLLFRDPKIKFWKKMFKKGILTNWGLVKISPKITKNAKWNNIWPKSKVWVHKTDRYGSYETVHNNIWEFYQVLKNIYGKWR